MHVHYVMWFEIPFGLLQFDTTRNGLSNVFKAGISCGFFSIKAFRFWLDCFQNMISHDVVVM